MIKRESYMTQIHPYLDKPFIKVLTGIRRCGKSSILMMFADELKNRGIDPGHIIHLNLENMDFSDLDTPQKLHTYLKQKCIDERRYYILLDEIQEVEGWEKAINSLMESANVDIYLTGSNSKLLSSELATYIAGRYIEINVSTLSFQEYLLFKEARTGKKPDNIREDLKAYIRLGGFPAIHLAEYDENTAYKIVNDIYSSAILRDTVQRNRIRNIELLERIVKFVFDNVGNTFSAKSIADYFKSQQRKIDLNTVYIYLNALESAFIIKRIQRYDIKGKEILQTNEKYFIGDPSLSYSVMGFKDRNISGVLENIVMLEAARRGYKVFIGKLDNREIDFIAERRNEKLYIQVAYLLGDSRQTVDREYDPLLAIRDHYPKYVVTMDDFRQENIEGIKHVYLADFLLMEW